MYLSFIHCIDWSHQYSYYYFTVLGKVLMNWATEASHTMRHWQFFHALMSFSFYGCQDFSWHFHYCTFDEIIYPKDIRDSKSTSTTVSSLILCQVISLTSVYHAIESTVIAIKKNELKRKFLSCANSQMVANISPYKYN